MFIYVAILDINWNAVMSLLSATSTYGYVNLFINLIYCRFSSICRKLIRMEKPTDHDNKDNDK